MFAEGEAPLVGHLGAGEVLGAIHVLRACIETQGVLAHERAERAGHPPALKGPGVKAGLLTSHLVQGHAQKDHGTISRFVLTQVAVRAVLLAELGTKPRVSVVWLQTVPGVALLIAQTRPPEPIGRGPYVLDGGARTVRVPAGFRVTELGDQRVERRAGL